MKFIGTIKRDTQSIVITKCILLESYLNDLLINILSCLKFKNIFHKKDIDRVEYLPNAKEFAYWFYHYNDVDLNILKFL